MTTKRLYLAKSRAFYREYSAAYTMMSGATETVTVSVTFGKPSVCRTVQGDAVINGKQQMSSTISRDNAAHILRFMRKGMEV